jgi:hypothetical protein
LGDYRHAVPVIRSFKGDNAPGHSTSPNVATLRVGPPPAPLARAFAREISRSTRGTLHRFLGLLLAGFRDSKPADA